MKLFKTLKSIIPFKKRLYVRKVLYRLSLVLFPFNYNYLFNKDLIYLRSKINLYFVLFSKRKFSNEIDFLNSRAETSYALSYLFPYSFVFDYDYDLIKVFKDDQNGLFYVIHKGKKLYYSRSYLSEIAVKYAYNFISVEQDKKSPHRYINEKFDVERDDVVIDIGAAEGNFSLETVEKASTLYIFETDINWIEALNATFEPWKSKVHIINKFVSDIDNDKCVTLDNFMGNNAVNFIKMDAEGAEIKILQSAKKILSNNDYIKLAICTYHKKNDAKVIEKILIDYKFNYSFTNGYMLYINDKLSPPYFRNGVMKAQKNKRNKDLKSIFAYS